MPTSMRVEGIEETFLIFGENEREEYSKHLREGFPRGKMITPTEVKELRKFKLSKEEKLSILHGKLLMNGHVQSVGEDVVIKGPEPNSVAVQVKVPEQAKLFSSTTHAEPARKKRRGK